MIELMNTSDRRKNFRWQLLATVSALALLGSAHDKANAADDDRDHPTVWIELGGQFESLNAGEEKFAPSILFATPRPAPETISPLSVGHPPRFSIGGEGKVTFEPEGTNWVFSAAIRYGRSIASQHLRQQSPYPTQPIDQTLISRFPGSIEPVFRKALQFIDTKQLNRESHAILDFQAGKDVGLGMFGSGSASVFGLGVRFAQFGSMTNVAFKSDPDAHPTFIYFGSLKVPNGGIYHSNEASADFTRTFHGIGPSISWNASAPVVGNPANGQVMLDWGANAAFLFGRQKAFIHHQTTAHYHHGKYNRYNLPTTPFHTAPPSKVRSRTVTVPNVGGFAGLTFRLQNFKVCAGYRADLFFGAMDGGVDAAKKENRGFYGPFASVSVGLGG
jgi:hypothetical protein